MMRKRDRCSFILLALVALVMVSSLPSVAALPLSLTVGSRLGEVRDAAPITWGVPTVWLF